MWTSKKSILRSKSLVALLYFVAVLKKWHVSAFVPTINTGMTSNNNNCNRLASLCASATKNPFSSLPTIEGLWKSLENFTKESNNGKNNIQSTPSSPGVVFLNAINDNNIDEAMTYIIDNEEEEGVEVEFEFEFEDTDFPSAWNTREELERNLRLRSEISNDQIIVIDEDIYDPNARKSGVAFHLESEGGGKTTSTTKKAAAFF